MANLILINKQNTFVWADHAGDFGDSPVAGDTQYQITLASLASAGARQGVKGDLSDPRADAYDVTLTLEWDVAPADGATASLYFANSADNSDFSGGASGADAAYTGTAGSTIAESLAQCQHVMTMPLTNDAATVVQHMTVRWIPVSQYIAPIVLNEGGQALEGDDIEMSILLVPVPLEVQ